LIEQLEALLKQKIADVHFAYRNSALIKLLRERGQYIIRQEFEKVKKVNECITHLKEAKYQDLTYPVCCFITFEEEAGFNKACAFSNKGEQILGELVSFTPAPEPTNIIWENREIEGFRKFGRYFLSLFLICFLIGLSFTAILLCKQYSI